MLVDLSLETENITIIMKGQSYCQCMVTVLRGIYTYTNTVTVTHTHTLSHTHKRTHAHTYWDTHPGYR